MSHSITLTTHSRPKRLLWWAVPAVTVLAGMYGYRSLSDPTEAPVELTVPTQGGIIQATPAPSLTGTTPDGRLHDGQGELVLSSDLLRRFDYWLTTYGEKSLDAIKADILADLRSELSPASLARASKLLDAYFAYKTELSRLPPLPSGTQAAELLAPQVQAIRAVRARHFSATEIAQLFGTDDAQDDETLSRLRIMQDSTLSEADKNRKLRELTAQLPAQLRANRTEPVLHLTVSEAVADARARGASAQEVQAIRTNLVGADAAQRLGKLDEEEAAWQARVQHYLSLRKTDETAAEKFKESNFSENEQLRLSAYP